MEDKEKLKRKRNDSRIKRTRTRDNCRRCKGEMTIQISYETFVRDEKIVKQKIGRTVCATCQQLYKEDISKKNCNYVFHEQGKNKP